MTSWKVIPRLDPSIVTTVPPSMGPATGLNYWMECSQRGTLTMVNVLLRVTTVK